MKSLPSLLTRKTSVNWQPRILHCARKQWNCCCLAGSFGLKQTWKQKSFFVPQKNALSLVVFFLTFRCVHSQQKPREKTGHVKSFIWLMRWFPFEPSKKYANKKQFYKVFFWEDPARRYFEIDQNAIIVKTENTNQNTFLSVWSLSSS